MFQNQDPAAALLAQFITAPDEESRYPFLGEGDHDLVLANFTWYTSKKNGFTMKAEWLVAASTNSAHRPGSFATTMWTPHKQVENYPGYGDREAGRARKCVGQLMNGQALNGVVIDAANPEAVGNVIMFLLQSKDAQPARGVAVHAQVSMTAPKPGAKNRDGSPKTTSYPNTTWSQVHGQTPQSISEWRAKVDALLGAQAPVQPGPHAATQPQFAPAQYQGPGPGQQQNPFGQPASQAQAPAGFGFPAQQAAPAQNPFAPQQTQPQQTQPQQGGQQVVNPFAPAQPTTAPAFPAPGGFPNPFTNGGGR